MGEIQNTQKFRFACCDCKIDVLGLKIQDCFVEFEASVVAKTYDGIMVLLGNNIISLNEEELALKTMYIVSNESNRIPRLTCFKHFSPNSELTIVVTSNLCCYKADIDEEWTFLFSSTGGGWCYQIFDLSSNFYHYFEKITKVSLEGGEIAVTGIRKCVLGIKDSLENKLLFTYGYIGYKPQ